MIPRPASPRVLELLGEAKHGPASFRGSAWNISAVSRCDPRKAVNQDGALVIDHGPKCLFVCVVDGMGGMVHGERAASTAVDSLRARLSEWEPDDDRKHALIEAFQAAHFRVLDAAPGGGATVVAAAVTDGAVQLFHAGDAEALVIGKNGKVKHWTVPHSPVGRAIHEGRIEREDAFGREDRHIVYNGFGVQDMSIEVSPEIPFADDDALILGTDGLTDNVRVEEIVEMMRSGALPDQLQRMTRLATRRMDEAGLEGAIGKVDDLTVIALRRNR